jgi:hypothetical protein
MRRVVYWTSLAVAILDGASLLRFWFVVPRRDANEIIGPVAGFSVAAIAILIGALWMAYIARPQNQSPR